MFYFSHSVGNNNPNWRTSSFFRGVGIPPTSICGNHHHHIGTITNHYSYVPWQYGNYISQWLYNGNDSGVFKPWFNQQAVISLPTSCDLKLGDSPGKSRKLDTGTWGWANLPSKFTRARCKSIGYSLMFMDFSRFFTCVSPWEGVCDVFFS